MRINKDDPRLIDYVLDELKPRERAAVEAAIREDDNVKQAVEEIRVAVNASTEVFEHEPAAALTQEQRRAILASSARRARLSNAARSRSMEPPEIWLRRAAASGRRPWPASAETRNA